MLYLNTNTTSFYVSKHTESVLRPISLILRPSMSKNNSFTIELNNVVPDLFYYNITIDDNLDIPTGEYTYILADKENNEIEHGLMIFGDYIPANDTIYNKTEQDTIYEK